MMKVVLPYGTRTFHRQFTKNLSEDSWVQVHQNIPLSIQEKLIKLTNYKGKKKGFVRLHLCSDSVGIHKDCITKSIYIIPVQVSSGWSFFEERYYAQRILEMKKGSMIKFNDYNPHALWKLEKCRGNCIFYTVEFLD